MPRGKISIINLLKNPAWWPSRCDNINLVKLDFSAGRLAVKIEWRLNGDSNVKVSVLSVSIRFLLHCDFLAWCCVLFSFVEPCYSHIGSKICNDPHPLIPTIHPAVWCNSFNYLATQQAHATDKFLLWFLLLSYRGGLALQ